MPLREEPIKVHVPQLKCLQAQVALATQLAEKAKTWGNVAPFQVRGKAHMLHMCVWMWRQAWAIRHVLPPSGTQACRRWAVGQQGAFEWGESWDQAFTCVGSNKRAAACPRPESP
eukprot:1151186-Pelagomonas_calceolata.AAC.15